VTPTLLAVRVELPDAALSASKGEMAAGPQAIGFSLDPVILAIAILVIALVAAGTGYYLRQKRADEKRE
jgi:lysozyme family protein